MNADLYLFDITDIGTLSAIIYTAGLNKFDKTKDVADRIFNQETLKGLFEQEFSLDQ